MKEKTAVILILAIALFAGVTGSIGLIRASVTALRDLPVRAEGRWQDSAGQTGLWSAQLAIHGNELRGEIRIRGMSGFEHGTVAGYVREVVEFIADFGDGQEIDFTGSVEAGVLEGTYRTQPPEKRGSWYGTWKSNAPAPSASWPADTTFVPLAPAALDAVAVPSSIATLAADDQPDRTGFGEASGSVAAVSVGANSLVNDPTPDQAQNEPEVAVFRGDPSIVAAGANDYSFATLGFPRPGYYASVDGGVTWSVFGQIPGLEQFAGGGDPVLEFSHDGLLYYAGIAFDSGCAGGESAVFVARSLDGGQTFENAVQVAYSLDGTVIFEDKPWLAVDRVSLSPHLGNVYVSWTRFFSSCSSSRIRLATSSDYGMTFDEGRDVSDAPGGQGSSLAVGLDGNLNIVWERGSRLEFDQCPGDGSPCGADVLVTNMTRLPSPLPGARYRVNSWPSLAVDNEISSYDGGNTFSSPVQVNDAGDIFPTKQFGTGFVGDYIGIDTSAVRHPIWMDSRRITSTGIRQQDVYTTVLSGC